MNNDYLNILSGLVAGIVLGSFFFGGLWYTAKRLRSTRNPAALFLVSFFGRAAVSVLGFFLVLMFASLPGLLSSLGAFIIVQFALVHRLRRVKGAK